MGHAIKTGKVYVTYRSVARYPTCSRSEDFREFAEITPSVIEIWVYAES